jgi:hypothetical protein
LGVKKNSPDVLLRVPGHSIFPKCADVGNTKRGIAKQLDHCTCTKLRVARAAPVAFSAPDPIARRQDLAFFIKCIEHDYVGLEVPRRLQFLCGIYADPLLVDAETEKCDQHLALTFPGTFGDRPGPAEETDTSPGPAL